MSLSMPLLTPEFDPSLFVQVQQVREFIEEYCEPFDRHVQAHIIILSNPVIRAFARLLLRVFEPPQVKLPSTSLAFPHLPSPPHHLRLTFISSSTRLTFTASPQPYLITKDDAAADEFASSCCNRPRSYLKASYNTTHEFKFPGLS